ncbi:MAG: ferrichrome-iron receptor [Pseudomonadota bacterium]
MTKPESAPSTCATLSLALAALCPIVAAAEDADAVLPSVEVQGAAPVDGYKSERSSTATRTDTPLRDIPQSVTVVPEALMEAQAAFNLRDALRNVPGLTLAAGEGGRTGDSITLRGFAANSDTYLDGVKDNGQYFRDTFFLEGVDVLKGPSSMLFGRGSTGGVINLLSKQPHPGQSAEADLSLGSYDLRRATVDGNFGTEELAGRVSALYHDSDSFRDENFLERKAIAPTGRVKLGSDSSLTLSGLYQREDSVFDYGVPMFRGRPADVDRDTFYGFSDDRFQEFDVAVTTATLDMGLSDHLRLRNTTRYGDYQRDYRTHLFGDVTDLGRDSTVARSQALRASGQQNLINQTDLILKGNWLGYEHTVLFGAELAREDYDFRSRNSTDVAAISIFDPVSASSVGAGRANDLDGTLATDRDTEATTRALYVQEQLALDAQWKLVGGARFDRFEADFDDRLTDDAFSETTDFWSPRAGVVWQPTELASWYASVGRSFNPSAETFTLSAATQDLSPEESTNYEVGTRHELLDGRMGLAAALFRLDKDKARTPDPNDPSLTVLAGQQVTNGLEVELNGKLTETVSAFASVAWLDAEIAESNALQDGMPIEGNRPPNVARQQGVVWADWAFAPQWTLGGGVYFVSSRYTDNGNTAELPGYERLDLMLGYEQAQWALQLNVQNLTDEEYYESGQLRSALPGSPRAAILSLRVAL